MEIFDWLGKDNKIGHDIWNKKYRYENESFDEWIDRISNNNEFVKSLILQKKFLFGGRILSNRGLYKFGKNVSYSNCYVIPAPQDSMKDIMRCASDMAETYKTGGGCGIHLNNLRPSGTEVNNNAKTTSGPISFMDLYSTITGVVAQNGRRGALMIAMNVSHPDIESFINIKQDLNKVDKANISVMVDDNFMKAVSNDTDYELYFKTESGKEIKKSVKAREIMQKIAFNAWDMGEPGMLFWDTVNNYNLMKGIKEFKLECTNPCLTKENKVYIADGRGYVEIGKLAEEGKDVDVFCYDNSGKTVIRTMRNPRITGHNQQIYKVTIEGNHSIRCTGNHKFLLKDGTYKEAKDLIPGDSLDILTRFESVVTNTFKKNTSNNKYSTLLQNIIDEGYEYLIDSNIIYVQKTCEICGSKFYVEYNRREISICTDELCISAYKNKNTYNEFYSLYNHKVISVELDGIEDVYNGTVDEYHNFFTGGFEEIYDENNKSYKFISINNLQCGELPLPSGSSCLLGSINLSEYVSNPFKSDASFDFKSFNSDIEIYVKALDECLDEGIEFHALDIQKQSAKFFRAIGLGVMGVAHMAIKMNLEYGSEEFNKVIDKIGFELCNYSIKASANLAKDNGKAPCLESYKNSVLADNPFIKSNTSPSTIKLVKKYGLRHCQLLTTAPTGTISTMIQTSGGIEPLYDCSYIRTTKSLHSKDTDYEVFEKVVEDYKKIHKVVPEWIRQSTAKKLDYIKRIVTQSIWQKHIDNAISSTINLSETTTVDDIINIYIKSWELGLKGVTVFRDNCRRIGILNSVSNNKKDTKPKDSESDDNLKWGDTIKSSDDLIGFKKKLNTGCGSLHVQAFFDNSGNFREIYLSKGSTGGCNSFMVGLSRMISLVARAGVPLDKIIDQLHSTIVCPSYVKRAYTSAGTSCPNALGHALVEIQEQCKEYMKCSSNNKVVKVKEEKIEKKEAKEELLCPECKSSLIVQEGCISCKSCGYSKCS